MRVLNSTFKQFLQQKKFFFTLFDALKKQSIFIAAFLLLSVSFLKTTAQVAPGTAPVAVPAGGFQIEGDLQANTPLAGKGDWLPGIAGAGGNVLTAAGVPVNASTTFHLTDPYNTSENNFSGGKKFDDNPNIWTWTNNKALGKCDINNALFHFTTSNVGGVIHTWLIVAADRLSNSGNAYIDFELLQNTMTDNANGTFSSAGPNNGRTKGDILLTLALTNGGGAAEFFVNKWDLTGGIYDYIDKTSSTPAGSVYASTNAATVPVSFSAFGLNQYSSNLFVEAAIDLTALLGAIDPCTSLGVKTLFIKTKTSQSPTATIVDFISAKQVSLQIGVANAGQDQSQCGNAFSVTGAATPSPGDAVSSTSWSLVSGSASIASPTALTSGITVTGSPATLRFTVKTTFGCTVSDDVVLTVTPGPSAPTITSGAATCSSAGSSTISNYSASNTYVFTPSGPSVGTGGLISGMTVGTSYTVTSNNGTCPSAASAPFSNAAMLVTPAAPTITPGAATCSSAGSSTISNYNASNTYAFTPSGPSVGTGGLINGMTVGTSYTVTSNNGSCTSAASAPFSNAAMLVTPATPAITPGAATCSSAGSSTISNYSALNTYVFTPSGPSVGTGGLISGMTVGTSYTVTSNNGSCTSAASAPFSNAATLVTPATPTITSGAATCSSAGSSTISNYSASNTYVFTPSGPSVGTGGLISGMTVGTSYTVTSNNGSCTSLASTSFSNAANLANPTFKVCVVQPTLCSTGSLTINATGGTGFLYTIDGTDPTATNTSNVFNNLNVGSVTTIKVKNSAGCSAAPVNCADIVSDCSAPAARLANNTATAKIADISEKQTTIKAYPNPFSDKIKFVVTSPVSGTGNLEVYNTMGQKIKTVYAGLITAGSHNFELSLPVKNAGSLIYILRIGDKKMTGTLLQMKR